jgi:hypothetical protein
MVFRRLWTRHAAPLEEQGNVPRIFLKPPYDRTGALSAVYDCNHRSRKVGDLDNPGAPPDERPECTTHVGSPINFTESGADYAHGLAQLTASSSKHVLVLASYVIMWLATTMAG